MSGTKDCKFCDKRGLLWLPLRYGAVGSASSSALAQLPKLTGKLGQGVADLALDKAKYAVRLLRSGYLYVLIERKGLKYWEAYRVLDDAFLYKFPPEDPPQTEPEFSCERHTCGINGSMVAIPEAKDVPHVWSLFTPAPLTKAKLDDYKFNAAKYVGEGKLQTFSPASWLDGGTAQPHTLLAPELLKTVAEYILFTQPGNPYASELGQALEQQLFPACRDAYAGTPPDEKGQYSGRLGSLYNTIRRAGYANFVLYDHIGLTQELNDFRNAALVPVETFLNKKEGEVENQRRLDVMQAIDDVHGGIKSRFIKRYAQQIEQVDQANLLDHSAGTIRQLRAMGRHAEADKVEAQAKESKRRKAMNRQHMLDGTDAEEDWQRLYAKHLDQDEIEKFRKALEALSERCGKQANDRAADHLLWVKSTRLVDAFDMFDPAEPVSGCEFSREHMHCTHGMFGLESNQPTLVAWMNVDKVERNNLYMRSNLYNQQDLIKAADKTFSDIRKAAREAGGVEFVPPDKLLKYTKSFVDALKKSDSAWDEWLRDGAISGLQKGEADKPEGKYQKDLKKLVDPADPAGTGLAQQKYKSRIEDLSKFHESKRGVRLARIAEWTRAVSIRGSVIGVGKYRLDHGIVAIVGLFLYSGLGRLTEKFAMGEFFLKLAKSNAESIRAQTQRAVAEGRMTPEQGDQHIKAYEKGGKYAAAPGEAARREGATLAKAAGEAERKRVDGSLLVLLEDEREKLRDRIHLTLEELSRGERPSTNNFRQVRMGVTMMTLEGLALVVRYNHHEGGWTTREKWEIGASCLSLASMSFDLVYASAKSLREIEAFSEKAAPHINKMADVYRGGFKITAGIFSAAAGAISVFLDLRSAIDEGKKEDRSWVLVGIYSLKIGVGATNAALGLIAAFSYTGPMLKYIADSRWASALRMGNMLRVGGIAAEGVGVARTLWLIRVARFNWIGLGLTAIEVFWACVIKDDELEKWCKSSVFRKDKNTKGPFAKTPYATTQKELEALEQAFSVVTGRGNRQFPTQNQTHEPKVLIPARAANAPG